MLGKKVLLVDGDPQSNRSDSCKRCTYSVGHYQILGYGVPAY